MGIADHVLVVSHAHVNYLSLPNLERSGTPLGVGTQRNIFRCIPYKKFASPCDDIG